MSFDLSPAWISVKVTLVATVVNFFLGIAIAWGMTKHRGKWQGLLDGVLTLPLVLPPTVAGFALLMLIGIHGPVGRLLGLFGVKIIFTWYAAALASILVAFPLMYRTARGAFEQIDPNILNAARTLGVSERRIFWRVAVPLAWPGIAAATALCFARSLGEFGATMMVAGNIPGRTQSIPLAIYFAVQNDDTRTALIWVGIIFVISLAVLFFMNARSTDKTKKRLGAGRS
ncbi:molybdate transport system permease protein [Sporobacter termitidis DSM 10068]|uniref:Molybdenum transport system permease n=1 Tax=Sporobacter termitidis DSM 10068 TaxID=1123282 RepID=A0A1M5UUG0_9FIRM|nr:molybdate ABC transporter permease subunit [Sporobacter termitidis]SHH66584.1 molybdate transport system permease protein [Sporobacter termitidis DSM 10068]